MYKFITFYDLEIIKKLLRIRVNHYFHFNGYKDYSAEVVLKIKNELPFFIINFNYKDKIEPKCFLNIPPKIVEDAYISHTCKLNDTTADLILSEIPYSVAQILWLNIYWYLLENFREKNSLPRDVSEIEDEKK